MQCTEKCKSSSDERKEERLLFDTHSPTVSPSSLMSEYYVIYYTISFLSFPSPSTSNSYLKPLHTYTIPAMPKLTGRTQQHHPNRTMPTGTLTHIPPPVSSHHLPNKYQYQYPSSYAKLPFPSHLDKNNLPALLHHKIPTSPRQTIAIPPQASL